MVNFSEHFPKVEFNPDARSKQPWLVDDAILQGKVTVVGGPEKVGKSRLISQLLTRMLASPAGGPVMFDERGEAVWYHHGFRRVLYLNADERTQDVQARINEYAHSQRIEPQKDWPVTFVSAAGMQLHNPHERVEFERTFLAGSNYDVVIVDPWRRVYGDGHDASETIASLHNELRRWTRKYNLTTILLEANPASTLAPLVDAALTLRMAYIAPDHVGRSLRRLGRFRPLPDLLLLDHGDPEGMTLPSR